MSDYCLGLWAPIIQLANTVVRLTIKSSINLMPRVCKYMQVGMQNRIWTEVAKCSPVSNGTSLRRVWGQSGIDPALRRIDPLQPLEANDRNWWYLGRICASLKFFKNIIITFASKPQIIILRSLVKLKKKRVYVQTPL